jgi:hypothetical protein
MVPHVQRHIQQVGAGRAPPPQAAAPPGIADIINRIYGR